MKIYMDIIIIENFIINLFILNVVAKILRIKSKKKYIYISALIGGVYTIVMFTGVSLLYSMPVKIFIVLLMVKLGLESKGYTSLVKATTTFFLVSFMLSGICFGLSINQNGYILGQAFSISNYSIKVTLLAIMLLYIVVIRIADYIRDRSIIKSLIYDIYINDDGKEVYLKGFLDTGNELREPISNLPCIIVSDECLECIELKENNMYKISYNTIDNYGTLSGFKFKEVKIKSEENNKWRNIEVIICLANRKLNIENEYQVLLSRGVI